MQDKKRDPRVAELLRRKAALAQNRRFGQNPQNGRQHTPKVTLRKGQR